MFEWLDAYALRFPAEANVVLRFRELLRHPDAFQRHHLPGHITGSAWILTPNYQQVVLVHHVKLNRWLQPGGHADGDTDVLRVALREAREETGLPSLQVVAGGVIDLDIHTIPAHAGFPEHDHYDVRFAFVSGPDRLIVSNESHDVRWVPVAELEQYNTSESILRLRRKMSGRA